ncbi:hypothetical protein RKE25_02545 [Dyella sp. BiH032]|uniref:hypothetical protein n=1 Tax=Dyella sp. BiH032 TaxID=3075430 RepID=UPI0028938203|nr:hypothetical protein [Dyella sp. BiH032]WNL46535.1 hypothetical protein RKE25_02545 [Dyella sp. BiH032]
MGIVIPFKPRRAPAAAPVPGDRIAIEALHQLRYLRSLLASEPGIRKRARSRLCDLADESVELLQHALSMRGH